METDLPRSAPQPDPLNTIPARSNSTRQVVVGGFALVLAVGPAVAAIWLVPGFVTQDGPAHLYNAQILASSLVGGDSPFDAAYEVRWSPLPNWAGHLALAGLMAAGASPWVADRIVMTTTLVGLAGAVLWLRRRVRGGAGLPVAAFLASVLALNVTWLLGFSSFLLGAILFPWTLGVWWAGRERPGPAWALAIALLMIAAYFAHIVALGLTTLGVVTLATATPVQATTLRRRWAWTLAGLAPTVPLVGLYRTLARSGGPIEPLWMEFENPLSLASWWTRLVWVDPLTLGSKVALPFSEARGVGYALLTPILWASLALASWGLASLSRLARERKPTSGNCNGNGRVRGWLILAVGLIACGVIGPDTLGASHGNYLSQRVILMGLIALVPFLDLGRRSRSGRFGVAALAVAWAMQSAFVWDYAVRSDRLLASMLQAREAVEPGDRIGVLVADLEPRFRANPLRHAGALLGVGTGGIVWSNYEAAHYYFPVRVRQDVDHPPVLAFEEISVLDDPAASRQRERAWRNLLAQHHEAIDLLVVRGEAGAALDAITTRWFAPSARFGPVELLHQRDAARPVPGTQDRLARFGPRE